MTEPSTPPACEQISLGDSSGGRQTRILRPRAVSPLILKTVVFLGISAALVFVVANARISSADGGMADSNAPTAGSGDHSIVLREEAIISVSLPKNLSAAVAGASYGEVMDRLVANHAVLAASARVLQRALVDDELRGTKWYKQNPAAALTNLVKGIRVRAVPGTTFVAVSARCGSKSDNSTIANAVAKAYVQNVTKAERYEIEGDIKSLLMELENLTSRMEMLRREIRTSENAGMEGRSKRVLFAARLQNLQEHMGEAKLAAAVAKTKLAAIQAMAEAGTLAKSAEVARAVDADTRLSLLRRQESDLTVTKVTVVGDDHNALVRINSRLGTLGVLISQREKELTMQAAAALIEAKKAAVDSTAVTYVVLQEEYDSVFAQLKDMEIAADQAAELATQLERMQDRKSRIEDRLLDLRIVGRTSKTVELVRHAEMP